MSEVQCSYECSYAALLQCSLGWEVMKKTAFYNISQLQLMLSVVAERNRMDGKKDRTKGKNEMFLFSEME